MPGQAGVNFGATSPTITLDGKRVSFLKNYSWPDVYVGELSRDGSSMQPARRVSLDNRGSAPSGWTPDGKAVILDSPKSGKSEIFKQGLNETNAQVVAQSEGKDCAAAAFTPDASWILYKETEPIQLGAPTPASRLMRRPAAGGSAETVFGEPGDMSWDFRCPVRPDASCVLSRYEGNELVFYALDAMRGRGQQLGRIAISATRLAEWSLSPEGSRLALVRGLDLHVGKIEVFTFGGRAWREIPVEPGWGIFQSVSWTSDGNGFFVTTWSPDSNDLLHVDFRGKVTPLLRSPSKWLWGPLPSSDGKHLAFQGITYDTNVWMLENF